MQRIDQVALECFNNLLFLTDGLPEKNDQVDKALSIIKEAIEKYANEQKEIKTDPYYDETFKTFYEKYGKKVGRVVAYRRWLKLKKSDIETILDTVGDFVLANPEPQYRPHPATYLAQKRWMDELPTRKERIVTEVKGRENTWKYEA